MKRRQDGAEPPDRGSHSESKASDARGIHFGGIDEDTFEDHVCAEPDDGQQYHVFQH